MTITFDILFGLGPLGFTWVKHYCTYDKGTKTFTMCIAETKSGGKVVSYLYMNTYMSCIFLFYKAFKDS